MLVSETLLACIREISRLLRIRRNEYEDEVGEAVQNTNCIQLEYLIKHSPVSLKSGKIEQLSIKLN